VSRVVQAKGLSTGQAEGKDHSRTAKFTCGSCEFCSLACLLSTALLATERADPPLSLRLQSCSRVVVLLPLALQTTLEQR